MNFLNLYHRYFAKSYKKYRLSNAMQFDEIKYVIIFRGIKECSFNKRYPTIISKNVC